jgi:hypothetical protein
VRADDLEEPGADPRHPIEAVQATERTPGLAIRHDLLGERETYAGQAGEVGRGGQVGVDPLGRAQGTGSSQDAVSVCRGRAGWKRGEELDLTRCVAGPHGPPAHSLPEQPQRQEQQERATLGGRHERMVGMRPRE